MKLGKWESVKGEFKFKEMYPCERCDTLTDGMYGNEDETLCESCFNDAINYAEYLYDSAREEGAI